MLEVTENWAVRVPEAERLMGFVGENLTHALLFRGAGLQGYGDWKFRLVLRQDERVLEVVMELSRKAYTQVAGKILKSAPSVAFSGMLEQMVCAPAGVNAICSSVHTMPDDGADFALEVGRAAVERASTPQRFDDYIIHA